MRVSRLSRLLLAVLTLSVAGVATAARDDASTVGSVAEDNGLKQNGWAIVKTPSILRIEMSDAVPTDIPAAITHYDRILELPNVDPELRAEAMRRTAYLRVQRADGGEFDAREVRRAIAIYNQLLKESPNDPGNDRTLYQLARAYQLVNETDNSIAQLQDLGRRYPHSAMTGDGVFRVAELLYSRERYAEAESNYRTVLNLGSDTPYFQPAEYKYGWAIYQQGHYPQALPVFLGILDRELPQGDIADPAHAFDGVSRRRVEVAQDSLRVASLSFAALGGGPALNDYFAKSGEPRYSTLLYNSVGNRLLEKQRYTDAAGVYTAFVERHPGSERAPDFQAQVIAAYKQGGFNDLVLQAKETYATRYAPGSPYWSSAGSSAPRPEILAQVRTHMDDIAHHYQAFAQSTPISDAAKRRERFLTAANWYQRTLELFPNDPKAADLNLLYADALYDGGQTQLAAQQYANTAYNRPGFAKAPEAAYASVQAYQRLATETQGAGHDAALRESVNSSLKLADTFASHPQWSTTLTRASQDLYALNDHEQAITVANRVLGSGQPLSNELRRQNLAVVADAQFAKKQYPEAEAAYVELLKVMPADAPERSIAVDQLAASVYKQAEKARDAGDLNTAAASFLRVGKVAPQSAIRVNADYDAASAYYELKNWPATEATLEDFRSRYPQHALAADVDKRLASAYEKDSKPHQAADVYTRVARRPSETVDTRREAAWAAATLYDTSKQPAMSSQAYEFYLTTFTPSLDRGMQARRRLADIARDDLHDTARYERYLSEIVVADRNAGSARNDASKLMAAQANLEIGRGQAQTARQLALSQPLEKSLAARKSATDAAVASLSSAAGYGYADVTTAATYELGTVYRDFGKAILDSARPANLKGEPLEQYKLLLEEQANPFEEKAIETYEANLGRMKQGLWNDWIHRSANALVELAPAKYGKHDQRETIYDSLL
ncbi:tetratricopeptide repeat protein [Hydrocarboniphaga sp.]|uniref:tetratricopeptide repeat protein n=1 Tax=Hydrocarboniphaga sp. TaxID=2033016 RepID=UPI00260D8FB1|nr:tetratricopeptide repeat protein [Hydrocarboniphaga sp.]